MMNRNAAITSLVLAFALALWKWHHYETAYNELHTRFLIQSNTVAIMMPGARQP